MQCVHIRAAKATAASVLIGHGQWQNQQSVVVAAVGPLVKVSLKGVWGEAEAARR